MFFAFSGTPEERLQEIMTRAKESGVSIDKIFSYFQGENKADAYITKHAFFDGLRKLGDNLFMVTDEEMSDIVKKFDVNGDGMISLPEFKTYCFYRIPGVAWKAERQRLEVSGEILKITTDLKDGFARGEIKIYPCGDEVFRASKLFWQTDTSVEMNLFYCVSLDVITVRLFNLSNGETLPNMYVKKSECIIDRIALEDSVATVLQTSGVQSKEEGELMRMKEEWIVIGKYILARLKLKQSPTVKFPNETLPGGSSSVHPYLCKLAGE